MRFHHLVAGFTLEWVDAGQRLVIDAAHRIHVGPRIDRDALELLGGHEKDRAKHRLDLLQILLRLRMSQSGQAEIHDLHLEFARWQPRQHQIRRLDVAVNQVEFLRRDQRLLGLERHFPKVGPSQRCPLDQFVERLAADQFHHHIRAVLIRADVVNRDDVRVLQRGQSPGFLDQLPRRFFQQRWIILRH